MTHSRTNSNVSSASTATAASTLSLQERCKLGRALASQWFSLTIQRHTAATSPPTPSAAVGGHPPSSFLEAIKRPTTTAASLPSSGTSNSAATPWGLMPLVPVDDCLHTAVLGILRDIAVAGAVLPESNISAAARASPPSIEGATSLPSTPPLRSTPIPRRSKTPDPDAEHWRSIKQKLLQLRTQIRNRDEFDRGLTQIFGDEWRRTVEIGVVDLPIPDASDTLDADGAQMMEGSITSEPRGRSESVGLGRSVTTAPPSPICHPGGGGPSSSSFEGSTPPNHNATGSVLGRPPTSSSTIGGSSPPPTFAESVAAKVPTMRATPPPTPTSRKSPPPGGVMVPPQIAPSLGMTASSPLTRNTPPSVVPAPSYYLESKDEMLRRKGSGSNHNAATGGDGGGTASLGSSLTSIPPSFAGFPVMGFPSTPVLQSQGGHGSPTPPKQRSLGSSPLIGPNMQQPTIPGLCPFDFIMVLDFEATCEEPTPPNFLHEIIEFPVVVVDVHQRRVCAEFHSFVRPSQNSVLSGFCTQLTGIRQEDVDHAPLLPEVIRRFEQWYKQTFIPQARVIFATDGPWDMRDFMYHHSFKRQGIAFPPIFYQWIDVKASFANFFHMPRTRIVKMLEYLGLPLDGRLHSGIDDARNIAKIVIGLLMRGCSLCDLDRIQATSTTNASLLPQGSAASTTAPASIDSCPNT